MANYLSPFSSRQFIDANGNPYSGAKLFTYVGGSTTKTTTYKDSSGSSSHTNPIILNTKGEPADGSGVSYPIWSAGGTDVKYVLAPSTDTDPPVSAIATWDNISGINDTSVTISEWISGPTPTYVSATSFALVGDQTSTFNIGRRIKTTNSGGNIYSTISNSVYGASTTVTVVNDSGTLDSGLSAVSYGILSATHDSIPGVTVSGSDWTHQGQVTISGKSVWMALGANIASAATTNIWSTDGNTVHVTGTTTITSFGTAPQAGSWKRVIFDGALTLTNGANLILPEGTNITTAAGDSCIVYADTTTKFYVFSYTRSSNAEYSIASAATVNIGVAPSNNVLITGTTTITAFDTVAAGIVRAVRFSGSLTLTYNATSMILPGSTNILVQANDCFTFLSLGSGNWVCTKYEAASGVITTIASGSLSGASVTVTNIPQYFGSIVIFLSGASSTSAARIDIQLSTNNGSSYDTTAANYSGYIMDVTGAAAATSNSVASATMTATSINAANTGDVMIQIDGYQAGPYKNIRGRIKLDTTIQIASGAYISTSAINALKLIPSAGTFDAGTYAIYGVN